MKRKTCHVKTILMVLLAVFMTAWGAGSVYSEEHVWVRKLEQASTVSTQGKMTYTCSTCGKKMTKTLPALTLLDSVRVKNASAFSSATILMERNHSLTCQGTDVVRIIVPFDGDLYIGASDRSNISSLRLFKATTFKDAGTLISSSAKKIEVKTGAYYLRIKRNAVTDSKGAILYYPKASFKLRIRCVKENVLTAKDSTRTYSSKEQKFRLNVTQTADQKLTYSSTHSGVRVSSTGVVTVAPYFIGEAQITIEAAGSSVTKAAETTCTVKCSPPATTLNDFRNMTGNRMKLTWSKKTGVTGYQIQYSRSSGFDKCCTTKHIAGDESTAMIVSGIIPGIRYYARVRTYKTAGDKTFYSAWSTIKVRVSGMRVLMIGNSLTKYNNLAEKVAVNLGAEVVPSVKLAATLADHYNTSTQIGVQTRALLKDKWDYVVIQEHSMMAIRNETTVKSFRTALSKLCKLAEEAGAKTVLYETWAYQPDSARMLSYSYSYDTMYKRLSEAHHAAAVANGMLEAKVGKTFYDAGGASELYDTDGVHPSDKGTDVAARVIATAIFAAE